MSIKVKALPLKRYFENSTWMDSQTNAPTSIDMDNFYDFPTFLFSKEEYFLKRQNMVEP